MGLNTPVYKAETDILDEKEAQILCCIQAMHFKYKDTNRFKVTE